jgi:hypothetical protein
MKLISWDKLAPKIESVKEEIDEKFKAGLMTPQSYHKAMFLMICRCVEEGFVEVADDLLLEMSPIYFKTDFLEHLQNENFKVKAEKCLEGIKNGRIRPTQQTGVA